MFRAWSNFPARFATRQVRCGVVQAAAGRCAILDFRTRGLQPSPEQIDACRANPEAMEALEAGDAERFARAMGVDQSESRPATAALPANIPGQTAGSQSKPSPAAQMHRP